MTRWWDRFGGILGDDPPRGTLHLLEMRRSGRDVLLRRYSRTDRTAELRNLGFPTRHLGAMQMTTDTALGVTKLVVQDQSMSYPPSFLSS